MSSRKYKNMPLLVDDFLGDEDVERLTLEETGAYLILLMRAWRRKNCDLPNDPKILAKMLGVDVRVFNRLWKNLAQFFDSYATSSGEVLRNKKLDEVRAFVDQKRGKAVAAAQVRWEKSDNPQKSFDMGDADAYAKSDANGMQGGVHAPCPSDAKGDAFLKGKENISSSTVPLNNPARARSEAPVPDDDLAFQDFEDVGLNPESTAASVAECGDQSPSEPQPSRSQPSSGSSSHGGSLDQSSPSHSSHSSQPSSKVSDPKPSPDLLKAVGWAQDVNLSEADSATHKAWLGSGLSPPEIVAVARAVMSRRTESGAVSSFRYFDKAMATMVEQKKQALAKAKQEDPQDALARMAEYIKSGKPYMCRDISASDAHVLIRRGLVTEAECRAAQVSV